MSRADQIIERTKNSLIEDGYVEKNVYERSSEGMGDHDSFFSLMIDRRLKGQKEPSAEEVWISMKQQINYAAITIADAEKEYEKLFNKHFDLKQLYADIMKSRP